MASSTKLVAALGFLVLLTTGVASYSGTQGQGQGKGGGEGIGYGNDDVPASGTSSARWGDTHKCTGKYHGDGNLPSRGCRGSGGSGRQYGGVSGSDSGYGTKGSRTHVSDGRSRLGGGYATAGGIGSGGSGYAAAGGIGSGGTGYATTRDVGSGGTGYATKGGVGSGGGSGYVTAGGVGSGGTAYATAGASASADVFPGP